MGVPLHIPKGSSSSPECTKKTEEVKKTYQSRLTRWVDRLLQIQFAVEHIPGKYMEFAEYLSRNLSGEPIPPYVKDNNFVIKTIEETKHALIRNNIAPFGAINAINASKHKKHKDVINTSHTHTKKTTFFLPITTLKSVALLAS